MSHAPCTLGSFPVCLLVGRIIYIRRVQAMISTSINPADTELDIRCVTVDAARMEDMHATTPMVVVPRTYLRLNEEELHTSFEEAISDRVLAVNKQLRRLSGTMTGN